MPGNRGTTSLRCKRRTEDPMRDFDRLPHDLRRWIATADLPWRPKSVHRSFDRAFAATGDREKALQELDRLQRNLVSKDARIVWGEHYPQTHEQSDQ